MTQRPAILAYAATPVGRLMPKGNTTGDSDHEILCRVVRDAVADAGIDHEAIGSAVFTAPTPATRQLGFATFLASRLGLKCTGQIAEVANMGISGGLAFDQAAADVCLGHADFALALGIEFTTGVPAEVVMDRSMRVVGDVDFQSPFGLTPIAWYALDASRYMHETGASRADLAGVAVKNRSHAALNPLAQYREPITLDDVLSQRPIVEPLGLYEVPPRSDGAICVVVTREDVAASLNRPYLRILGRGFAHDGYHQVGDHPHDMIDFVAARRASAAALEQAGVVVNDIDVAEIYAPCTITEILATEAIGMADKGKGVAMLKAGDTTLGGRIPVNSSGSCLSRGHPPGLTALYGLAELYDQALGRAGERQVSNARIGLNTCELGNYNAALVHVVEGVA